MDRINIERVYKENCTLGFGECKGVNFFTLELPWFDNQVNISCVYPGLYKAKKYISPKHGEVVLLENRSGRTYIEMHAGNYTSQIQGCILPGNMIKYINSDNIPDVGNSKITMNKILDLITSEIEG